MGVALLAVATILLIATLVYLRHMSKKHVAALLRVTIEKLTRQGVAVDTAIRDTTAQLRRRPPFSFIKEKEMNLFVDVLQDLSAPVDVAARVLQRCELRYNISSFQEPQTLMRLAYSEDLEIGLRSLIETATRLQRKANDKYPNIGIALLAAVSLRDGWIFFEEQAAAVAFKYLGEQVPIAKQSSGKDVARRVFFEELRRRPVAAQPGETYDARQLGRKELLENFDARYDEVFQQVAQT